MMRANTYLGIALMATLATGCDKGEEDYDDLVGNDPGNTIVALSMAFTHDGAALDTSTVLQDGMGTRFKIDRIRFYMCQFDFTDDNGDSVAAFPDQYILIDSRDGGDIHTIGQLRGHLHEMNFGLGVDSATNHLDVLTLEPPLSNQPELWWGWAYGHLFLTVDGRYDQDGDGVVEEDPEDAPFSYHCGMDTLYTEKTIEVHTDADMGGNLILPFALNVDTLMAQMNIAADPVEHEVSPVTQALMQKLAAGLSHVE